MVQWIRTSLRELERVERQRISEDKTATGIGPKMRRLTNVEYQNTMRDLMGFELKWSDRLPKDPVKPYRFNNTAELMRMGPEQLDLYLECARRAMAGAIVDPDKPETQQTRQEWKSDASPGRMPNNEVGIWGGGGRFSAAWEWAFASFRRRASSASASKRRPSCRGVCTRYRFDS
jgi:hypothetical protein